MPGTPIRGDDTPTITGTAVFNDETWNYGIINPFPTNRNPDVYPSVFKDSAKNSGTINGDAIFDDSGENKGIVAGDAEFMKHAKNQGTVQGQAKAVMRESGVSTFPDQAGAATHFISKNADFDEEGSPIWPAAGTEIARLAAADEESNDPTGNQITNDIKAIGDAFYGLSPDDYKKFTKLNKSSDSTGKRKSMTKAFGELYDVSGNLLEAYVELIGPGDFQYFIMMSDPLNAGSSTNTTSSYIRTSNIIKYVADSEGSYVKQYPPQGTSMFDASWFIEQFIKVISTQRGDIIASMNQPACMTTLPDLNTLPNLAAMYTFISDGNGSWTLQYPAAGTLLWDVDRWQGINDFLDGYYNTDDLKQFFIPDSAFVNIPELENAYWTEWLTTPYGAVGMPPAVAVVTYVADGNGGYQKLWPVLSTQLWNRSRYGEQLGLDPNFTLNSLCFINIQELEDVYWPFRIQNQPPNAAVATYCSDGAGGFYKEWSYSGTELWNYSLYLNMLQYDPDYQLPTAAFIQISELDDAYWTGSIPNQPPLASISTYKSDGTGSYYKTYPLEGTHLWGPNEYATKLAN